MAIVSDSYVAMAIMVKCVHPPLSRHILASAIKNLYESEEDVEEAPSNCNRCN